jgi:DNA replication and repair protein RecF
MQLLSVSADNFRNLGGILEPDKDLCVLVGDNGQGKTNWLEAIYLLGCARSFKTTKLIETIKFGEELGVIRGRVRRSKEIIRDLQVTIDRNIKVLSVNGKRAGGPSYLGELHAVLFDTGSLDIVRGTPEHRRRFLDDTIVAVHPPYIQTLSEYNRVIKQKNRLLQNAGNKEFTVEKTAELLEPWNEQLTGLSEKIHRSRERIVERLSEHLDRELFEKEKTTIAYRSSLEGKGDITDYRGLMAERLRKRVQAELVAGHSLIGPHRDDLEILFDGRDLRKFGSSGQQRSTVISLMLSSVEVFNSLHNEYPLFLIDDIDAELDPVRIDRLLNHLAGKCQTVVTTSKSNLCDDLGIRSKVVPIAKGEGAFQPDKI